jgi:hypothetical protein
LPNGKIHIAQLLSQKEEERQGGEGGMAGEPGQPVKKEKE